jgi:hypothetical protein
MRASSGGSDVWSVGAVRGAWLGGTFTIRSATRLIQLAIPGQTGSGSGAPSYRPLNHRGNRRCGEEPPRPSPPITT